MARFIAFAKASFLQIPPGANIFKDFLVKKFTITTAL